VFSNSKVCLVQACLRVLCYATNGEILQTLKTNTPKSIITLGSIFDVFSQIPRESVYSKM
jgi:hypothetical protein